MKWKVNKMDREIKIGNRMVGDGHPTYIIAEIGINHNGDLDVCKQMIAAAHVGSKGIPRMNIRPFAGQPLIAYSIAA